MELRKMLRVTIRVPGGKRGEHNKTLVRSVLDLCKDEGIIGASVVQAIHGYGDTDYEISILRGIGDLPKIVEIVDEPLIVKRLIPKIKKIIGENGLITIDEVYSV